MRVRVLALVLLLFLGPAAADPPPRPAPAPQDTDRPVARPETGTGAPALQDVARSHESDFDHSACLLELTLLGASYRELAPVTEPDDPDCGIARPIRLSRPLPGIDIPGGALMRCDTARHLAHWLRDFVRPAAAMLPGQPRLAAIEPGSTYQCRDRVGDPAQKLSQHALGNAFDIAAFRFDDGTRLTITPRGDQGDMAQAFQHALRATACLHFTTVLGPGSNAAHDDHLHLDIQARRNGWRICQ